jgi:ribosomal protein L40E
MLPGGSDTMLYDDLLAKLGEIVDTPETRECHLIGADQKVQSKPKRKLRLPHKTCPYTQGCNAVLGITATRCDTCKGGKENLRGKAVKDCKQCGGSVKQQAHACPKCGFQFDIKHNVIVCTVCLADNLPNSSRCRFCGATLREPRENAKPSIRAPRPNRGPNQPHAAKPQTVIRADSKEHLYSVRAYASGKQYRCACLWVPSKESSLEPLKACCNRAECLELAHASRAAAEPRKRVDAEVKSLGSSASIGGALFCQHLRLVEQALRLEADGVQPVEGPLCRLPLREEALVELTKENVISEDKARELLDVASAFCNIRPVWPSKGAHSPFGSSEERSDVNKSAESLHGGQESAHDCRASLSREGGSPAAAKVEAESAGTSAALNESCKPEAHDSGYGEIILVTKTSALVPVPGRSSAVQYGHVALEQNFVACHVAKGSGCSEYNSKQSKSSKHCLHTRLLIWGLKGHPDFESLSKTLKAPKASVKPPKPRSGQEAPSSTSATTTPPLRTDQPTVNSHQNEWDSLPTPKKLQIFYLKLAVHLPPKLPPQLQQSLYARHICRPDCPPSCPSQWPRRFASVLSRCCFCNSELSEKSFENVVLLDDGGVIFDRKIILQTCTGFCKAAFPPVNWEETGCAVVYCNKLILSLKLIEWIRDADTRGLAPTSSILVLMRRWRQQASNAGVDLRRLPSEDDVALAYWATESKTTFVDRPFCREFRSFRTFV